MIKAWLCYTGWDLDEKPIIKFTEPPSPNSMRKIVEIEYVIKNVVKDLKQ